MAAAASDYNGSELVAVAIPFLCLTYTSVLLRVFVRLKITKTFSLDDWFILVSQLVFTSSCIFIFLGVHSGLGRHNKSISQEREIESLKWQALATLFYVANMMFIKIGIALFLLRIAVEKRYIWILKISLAIVTLWSIAIFIYDLFQCWPIEAQWDYTIIDRTCVSGQSFVSAAYSISVMTIVSDWLYALLPIPMIWSVKMSTQAKLTVAFVLSLGIFASIATLIRLKYLVEVEDSSDALYTGTNSMIWTLVEPGLAIIAASLITMRPLLRAMRFRGFESNSTPHYPHPSIILRNNITSDEGYARADSTYTNRSEGLERISLKARGKPTTRVEAMVDDGGSEDYILEGIRRTVDVTVMHDPAQKGLN